MAQGTHPLTCSWVLGIFLGFAACAPQPPPPEEPPAPPEHRILIVLDNVRADRLAMCGHGRPTSSALAAFADTADGWTCHAYAPGSWTLPSHASFFTGLDVPEHGVHFNPGAVGEKKSAARAFPLDMATPTLAEQMRKAGYRTMLVSGNPIINKETGLTRGFETVRIAPQFESWRDWKIAEQVANALIREDLDTTPIFLVVNIADAHGPWPAIPGSVKWLKKRAKFANSRSQKSQDVRFVNGALDDAATGRYLARYNDAYDHGVFRADRTFGHVIHTLEQLGLTERARIVVTSDHGEFIGEHNLVGHCCGAWEEDARVPFLYQGPNADDITRPFSALQAFYLLRDGAVSQRKVRMANAPNAVWFPVSETMGRQTMAAEWEGTSKHLWIDGDIHRYDLELDPFEADPLDGTSEALDSFGAAMRESMNREATAVEGLNERLRALGYVDD